MRRFSSEGSLLDLDFLPWKKVTLKSPEEPAARHSATYTLHEHAEHESDSPTPGCFAPIVIREPSGKRALTKERSTSSENLDHGGYGGTCWFEGPEPCIGCGMEQGASGVV